MTQKTETNAQDEKYFEQQQQVTNKCNKMARNMDARNCWFRE